jgi:hypothetical protein
MIVAVARGPRLRAELMKRIYVAADPLFVGFLRSKLEEHGIACFVKNHFLSGAIGEIPPVECWPELWIVADADEARARELLE